MTLHDPTHARYQSGRILEKGQEQIQTKLMEIFERALLQFPPGLERGRLNLRTWTKKGKKNCQWKIGD